MELKRSRTALFDASDALGELILKERSGTAENRDFISTLAMIKRVGAVIDDEAKGQAFRSWWQQSRGDSLHQFIGSVRNDELKRGIERRRAQTTVDVNLWNWGPTLRIEGRRGGGFDRSWRA